MKLTKQFEVVINPLKSELEDTMIYMIMIELGGKTESRSLYFVDYLSETQSTKSQEYAFQYVICKMSAIL